MSLKILTEIRRTVTAHFNLSGRDPEKDQKNSDGNRELINNLKTNLIELG